MAFNIHISCFYFSFGQIRRCLERNYSIETYFDSRGRGENLKFLVYLWLKVYKRGKVRRDKRETSREKAEVEREKG